MFTFTRIGFNRTYKNHNNNTYIYEEIKNAKPKIAPYFLFEMYYIPECLLQLGNKTKIFQSR